LPPSSPAIEIRSVSRAYGGRTVVDQASAILHAGRITCLLGPSGGGKSTLLRLIAGLEDVDAGEILSRGGVMSRVGFTLPPERREIGLVFQDLALFPHLTAEQNIAFGLDGLPVAEKRDRVGQLLEQFRLTHRASAWPHTLSGGEQQRVAIARALARRPVAVLLDEPFSGLDGRLKDAVRGPVIDGLRAAGAAVMIVTHDPEEALLLADELVLMAEGRVLQRGEPDDCYLRPTSFAAAGLLGEAFAFDAAAAGGVIETVFGRFLAPSIADGPAHLLLRPESFEIDPSGVAVQVLTSRFAGAFWEVTVMLGETRFKARLSAPPPGEKLGLSIRPGRAHIVSLR
jgi:iron(III) transport system ATP-binding protein